MEAPKICGIVGIIAKNKVGFYHSDLRMFDQMIWADQLRGTDGTGIFYVDKNDKCIVHKAPVAATPFIFTEEYKKHSAEVLRDSWFLIGHNRASTKGEHTYKNTHPFVEKHITLIHNGTLPGNHDYLAKDTDVDSHAIAKHMAINGHKSTLGTVNGAFVLVWYDSKEKTLNLTRNSERPLFLIESKDLYIISSEEGLGTWLADRNQQTVIKITKLETSFVYSFSPDKLGTFDKVGVQLYTKPYMDYTKYNHVKQEATPTLGAKIIFSAYNYFQMGETYKIVGAPEDGEDDDIGDVVVYVKTKKELDELFAQAFLIGTISHHVSTPGKPGLDVVVKNVVPYVTKMGLYDFKSLSRREKKELKITCDCCNGWVNKTQRYGVERNADGDIESVYCHDCFDMMEKYNVGV